jgi:hypothetical protein
MPSSCRYVHTGGPPCAAFVGMFNSKACPQSYWQVKTEAACQSLAAIGGKAYGGSVNVTTLPPGCFWLTVGGRVYLNTHATGGAHANAQQLCVGAAIPPSRAQPRAPDAQARRHPCAHTHATCDGACRRACAPALRLVAVTNPPL